MLNSNAVWWYEYKYGDCAVDNSCYIIYIKHVHVFIYNSVWCCIILHLFHTNAIICSDITILLEYNNVGRNNINITK